MNVKICLVVVVLFYETQFGSDLLAKQKAAKCWRSLFVFSVYLNIDTRAEETQIEWQDPCVMQSERHRSGNVFLRMRGKVDSPLGWKMGQIWRLRVWKICVSSRMWFDTWLVPWFQSIKCTNLTVLVGVLVGFCVILSLIMEMQLVVLQGSRLRFQNKLHST